MSFKNYYLTRIPGSLNSKKCANNKNGNLQEEDPHQEEVTLVKEWNGTTKANSCENFTRTWLINTSKQGMRDIVNNHSMNINSLLKEPTYG